ncbi:hypothetical protein CMK14_14120 [Candidatus Poribacteria bacterium]|nr:hypothetical protein [Candidatus Poribacteria bacterium]
MQTVVEQLQAQSESANQAKSQFLSRMSHEIRILVHGVLDSLDLLLPGLANRRPAATATTGSGFSQPSAGGDQRNSGLLSVGSG